jgi:hypothetical protein
VNIARCIFIAQGGQCLGLCKLLVHAFHEKRIQVFEEFLGKGLPEKLASITFDLRERDNIRWQTSIARRSRALDCQLFLPFFEAYLQVAVNGKGDQTVLAERSDFPTAGSRFHSGFRAFVPLIHIKSAKRLLWQRLNTPLDFFGNEWLLACLFPVNPLSMGATAPRLND